MRKQLELGVCYLLGNSWFWFPKPVLFRLTTLTVSAVLNVLDLGDAIA